MNELLEALSNAIVVQAARDYRMAARSLKRNPRYLPALELKADVEEFFRSEWCGMLTTLDGEKLLERLETEAIRNERERVSEQSVQAGQPDQEQACPGPEPERDGNEGHVRIQ